MDDSMQNTEHTEETKEAEQEESRGGIRAFFGDVMDIIEAVVTSIFVIVLLFAYLMRPVTVDGVSMMPTLLDKDRLVMWSLGYTPKNGDIVIIDDEIGGHFQDGSGTDVYETDGMGLRLIKRVIAVAGQELNIDFVNGTVAVDGVQIPEPYIADLTTRDDGAFTYPIVIPEGYVFVMGDNRLHSTDSRNPEVALVPVEQVIGRAIWRFYRLEDECTSLLDRFALLI